jgi:hypothetical protein
MKKLLWKLFSAEILAYYNKSDKPELIFAFIDSEGRRYSTFPQDSELPLSRLKWLRIFKMWLIEGVTYGELGDLLQIQKKELAALITNLHNEKYKDAAANAGKVNNVISEVDRRRNMTFNSDLLIQYLSVQYIREDEDPYMFSPQIQDEKVKQFEKETNLNYSFFFGRPELKSLTHLYSLSQEEFVIAWQGSLLEKILNKDVMEILRSVRQ